jgi:hypothetical protein
MPLVNFKSLNDAYSAGQSRIATWRKAPTQATGANIWFDLSMSPGNPVPNYYAASPNIAIALAQSTDGGLFHGGDVTVNTATTAALGGSISGTTFTDTTHGTGLFVVGMTLTGTGVIADTKITALGTGTGQNSGGTYTVNNTHVGPNAVTAKTITGNIASGVKKFLHKLTALIVTPTTAVPLPMILCDYLLYYPFVDMSDTAGINLNNTVTLPRYTDGEGVQIMAVEVAGQSGIGNPQFNVTYTNQDGTPGRVTPNVACNTQTVNGTIITTAAATAGCAGPFLPLQAGDTGVRSIETVTFLTGDVGLISFVLVKPLATLSIHDITAPVERDYAIDGYSMPEIKPDAYLNFICLPGGTIAAGQLHGTIETVFL